MPKMKQGSDLLYDDTTGALMGFKDKAGVDQVLASSILPTVSTTFGAGALNAASVVNIGHSAKASGLSAVAVGVQTGYSHTGNYLTAVGTLAGYLGTGSSSNYIGYCTGRATTGVSNVGIGHSVFYPAVMTGASNTAGGTTALNACTSGTLNACWGSNSLGELTTGASNVGIGDTAGDLITAGNNNVVVGATADVAVATDNNSIVIGFGAVGIGTNTTVLGNSWTLTTKAFGVKAEGQVAPTITLTATPSTIAPTTAVVFVDGAFAIETITAPTGITLTGGTIIIVPKAAFTTTTNGNIAIASTAVVSRALHMTYDATTTKWYPSY